MKWLCWYGTLLVLMAAGGMLHAAGDTAVNKRVDECWMEEDYASLEKVATGYRTGLKDAQGAYPQLSYLYAVIRGAGGNSAEAAAERLRRLNSWRKQFPDSVTARVAMADFYVTEARRARGSGPVEEIGPKDWETFKERLQRAEVFLGEPGMTIESDPTIASLRVLIAMGTKPADGAAMVAALGEARDFWPGWFPGCDSVAGSLLPQLGGDKGAVARSAEVEANKFPGTEGDVLYAMLASLVLDAEGIERFPDAGFDVARFLRGLDVLASRGEPASRHHPRQRAAFVEATFGDSAKARERIFACGPAVIPPAYGDRTKIAPAWEKCGAMEELRKGIEFEKAGKLREALALYSAMTPSGPNPWVSAFALRNGVWNHWSVNFGTPVTGLPVERANGDQLFEMACRYICAGDLDSACGFAKAFDRERPQNVTGKYILVTAAALRGDQSAFEDEKTRFLAMRTNRKCYQIAQQYASGRLKWEAAKEQMPRDENFVQACSMMGAIALGDGRKDEAKEIFLTVHQELPFQEAVAFPESMLWGSLARTYPEKLGLGK